MIAKDEMNSKSRSNKKELKKYKTKIIAKDKMNSKI